VKATNQSWSRRRPRRHRAVWDASVCTHKRLSTRNTAELGNIR